MLTKFRKFLAWIFSLFFKDPEKEPEKIHIVELAKVMARFEGYYIGGSRAKRNNNPLNLKWSPFTENYDYGHFCIFRNIYDGWKFGLWDLEKKCKGYTRTGLNSESTVKELIYTWSATDQKEYAQFICGKLKIPLTYQLKEFSLKQINLTIEKQLKAGLL